MSKGLLVVSFGTSFNDSRVQDIKGIEDAIAAAFPDHGGTRITYPADKEAIA